jgi:hypothetical protein
MRPDTEGIPIPPSELVMEEVKVVACNIKQVAGNRSGCVATDIGQRHDAIFD